MSLQRSSGCRGDSAYDYGHRRDRAKVAPSRVNHGDLFSAGAFTEDAGYGTDRSGEGLPEESARRQSRLAKIRQANTELAYR